MSEFYSFRWTKSKSPLIKAALGLKAFNGLLLSIVCFCMFSVMCATVFFRYVLKVDLRGSEEYLFFISVWAVFLGSANGSFEKSHVCADTIHTLVKNQTALRVTDFIQQTVTLLLAAGFFYYGLAFIIGSIQLITYTAVLHLPYLIGHTAVFYGSMCMFLYTLLHYIDYVRYDLLGKPAEEKGQEP